MSPAESVTDAEADAAKAARRLAESVRAFLAGTVGLTVLRGYLEAYDEAALHGALVLRAHLDGPASSGERP